MLPILVILLVLLGLGVVLWVGQARATLEFAAAEVEEAWTELKAALAVRREMVPYVVAAIPVSVTTALDVIGNACDLAANVCGVHDSSQAEARLSSAINRLLSQLDAEAPIETREILHPLRDRLKEQDLRITVMKELYNHEVEVFNTLLKQGAARVLVSLGLIKPKEIF